MSTALTVRQVAERLNVNDRTVYRLAQAGKLPGFKVAGAWRFLKEDIEAWIDERKQDVLCDPTGVRLGLVEHPRMARAF